MSAFNKGFAAYMANQPSSANEYTYGTSNYDSWLSGWEYAEEQSV